MATVASLALLLGLIPLFSLASAQPASATFATGGSGLYKGDINWMTWGTAGSVKAAGATSTLTQTVGGQQLTTTCMLSNVRSSGFNASPLLAYRSGTWGGDGLDDLYNTVGEGAANTMVAGLTNSFGGDTVRVQIDCTATIGGVTAPLSGLVFADAEASNSSTGEYVAARPLDPINTDWRIIERKRPAQGCSTDITASLAVAPLKELKLAPTALECSSGPTAIAYADGATGLDLTIKGGGKSAIAIGVVLSSDFGDAPASYGSAGALFQPSWTGSALPYGDTSVFGLPTLPTELPAPLRLGALIDGDAGYLQTANASGDDTTDLDDEDAIGAIGAINVEPGTSYTLSNVACNRQGVVAGWIDWNGNGTFDTGERSATASCLNATGVNLTWTVPADTQRTAVGGSSFLRLRIATTVGGLTSPIGMSTAGEVEDHPLIINTPTLAVQKNLTARVNTADQFTLTLSGAFGSASATTTGTATGVQATQVTARVGLPGQTYTIVEAIAAGSVSTLADYTPSNQCTATYRNGTTAVLSSATGASGSVTVPALNTTLGHPAINCVFTNSPQPATVAVSKVWIVNGTSYTPTTLPAALSGLSAQATLTRGAQAVNPAWSAVTPGYFAGDQIAVTETTTIPAHLPGCTTTSQRVTSVNGTPVAQTLPYTLSARTGANAVTLTNTLTCTTSLTLTKTVVGGTALPGEWTLSALPAGTGAATVTGTTGATGAVTAGTTLQLAEAGGNAEYVQDDSRTSAEITAAPRSTGSWTCVALNAQNTAVAGILPARAGLDGTITPTLGTKLSCAATNRTAQITLLKIVENVNGTGTAVPANWNLTATAVNPVRALPVRTVVGSPTVAATGTFTVRPAQGYLLSEAGTVGGYNRVALQRFTGADPTNAAAIANAANWVTVDAATPVTVARDAHAVYRFINRDAVAFQLPFTGNTGWVPYLVGGGLLAGLSIAAAIIGSRRRGLRRS